MTHPSLFRRLLFAAAVRVLFSRWLTDGGGRLSTAGLLLSLRL
jgi:hypothetical protein